MITAVITVLILVALSLYRSNIQDVIICSADNTASYIPSTICSGYLYNFMGEPDEIKELEKNIGIIIAFDVNKEKEDEKLFLFLIEKGININSVNATTGFYPIHEAILRNNLSAVNLLLSHRANPKLKDKQYNLNSLDFTRFLIKKNPAINRSSVEAVLLKYFN
jgi:hypothetical protein